MTTLYEDRIPRDGFDMPVIGAKFRLAAPIRIEWPTFADIPVGTSGEVVCIREPLVPCGGYVGCGVTLDDKRFKLAYPSSKIIPWDEISDPNRFVF